MKPQITIIENALLLIAIGIVIYIPWQKLIISYVKQKIFEVREHLLLAGADRRISFSSKEYESIEKRLNSMIRFSDKVTWIRMFQTFLLMKSFPEATKLKPENDLYFHYSHINKELSNELTAKTNTAFKWILIGVVLRSPFLMLLTPVVFIVFALYACAVYVIKNKFAVEHVVEQFETLIEQDMQLKPC